MITFIQLFTHPDWFSLVKFFPNFFSFCVFVWFSACKNDFIRPISYNPVSNIDSCFDPFVFCICFDVHFFIYFQSILFWVFYYYAPCLLGWARMFYLFNQSISFLFALSFWHIWLGTTKIFWHTSMLIVFLNDFCDT